MHWCKLSQTINMEIAYLIPIFFVINRQSLACWGGGGGGGEDGKVETDENYDDQDIPEELKYGGVPNVSDPDMWGGWGPPKGADESWIAWLTDFKGGKYRDAKDSDPSLNDPNWPSHWQGAEMGQAFLGMPPPPWAYVPLNVGKPLLCSLPPVKGNCTNDSIRWGFNPFMEKCRQFVYSGCDGNQNNFKAKEKCEAICLGTPKSGCDPDSHISVDDLIIGRRCAERE